MKEPTIYNLERFQDRIKYYNEAIDNLDADDPESVKTAQAELLAMNVAWKNLTGIDVAIPNSSVACIKLQTYLEEYTGETSTAINDFIYRLKGEPDSLETLAGTLSDREVELTPKLLAEIMFRLTEYGVDLMSGQDLETTESYIASTDDGHSIEMWTRLIMYRLIRHIVESEENRKRNN